jgi:uncharacterized cupin superfamily protein
VIDFSTYLGLAGTDIGAFAPKQTSFEGEQKEAAKTLYQSPDGSLEIGIWECTPGRFKSNRVSGAEICHFISGRLDLTNENGEVRKLGPGDLLVLPEGCKSEWHIIEQVRKLYVIHKPAA